MTGIENAPRADRTAARRINGVVLTVFQMTVALPAGSIATRGADRFSAAAVRFTGAEKPPPAGRSATCMTCA